MISSTKERVSWYFYDWANSAFYTSVITVFLGPYLKAITHNAADINGYVYVVGIPIFYKSYFFYVLALSFILQFFLLPILGAIADYTNKKKFLLGLFAYIGAFSTMGLYFLEGNRYLLGGAFLLIANVSFGASIVMYNAYLSEISEPQKRDTVSSIGWALGYLGGGIVLGLNLILYSNIDLLGINESFAIRISLASTGVWWAIFTIIPMIGLKIRRPLYDIPKGRNILNVGFIQLQKTAKDSLNYPKTLKFLLAYLFYNEGVQVVIVSSAQFGEEELGLSISTLTTVILIVQFTAFLGSLFFNYLAKIFNTKNAILISLIIWTFTVFYAYQFLHTESGFYILGIIIALVLGGTQSLSRSLYSKLIPFGKEAEYFSLYEVSDRGTSLIGPLLFGITLQLTGSFRIAILSLCIFFIIGIILLLKIDLKNLLK